MAAKSHGLPIEAIRQTALDQTSMRRLVSIHEIASMIVYLCSPQGRIISGQSIAIDGHTREVFITCAVTGAGDTASKSPNIPRWQKKVSA
ncbi:hypothetical protein CO676_33430 [Sinorhizobium sp. BJ1]|nr:hypothetical protein CO676_33430 [Sinorhizobium sp. BJ1]